MLKLLDLYEGKGNPQLCLAPHRNKTEVSETEMQKLDPWSGDNKKKKLPDKLNTTKMS